MDIAGFFSHIPPELVYVLIGLIIGLESMGIPLPGETMLFTASIMATDPASTLSPWGIAIGAICGAIIGDSCGYLIGRKFGPKLFAFLGRKFPRHVTPGHVAYGQSLFARFGSATVFGGRFVALLRILAGPLAGMLHMPYRAFLLANAAGGIVWAGGVTWIVYTLGQVSQHWLENGALAALGVLIVGGLIASKVVGGRINAAVKEFKTEQAAAGFPLETFDDLEAFQSRSAADLVSADQTRATRKPNTDADASQPAESNSPAPGPNTATPAPTRQPDGGAPAASRAIDNRTLERTVDRIRPVARAQRR